MWVDAVRNGLNTNFERWWYRLGLEVAKPHTWLDIQLGYLPRLYMWHAIADMLTPSPLPLTIEYIGTGYSDDITTEDEEGMSLVALE